MANVRGLDDILGGGGGDDDHSKFNDYYAGGEKSGQLLRGAPEDEESEDEDQVGSIFDKVRRAGGVAGTADDLQAPAQAFRGVGRTLAGGVNEEQQASGPAVHVVTFYRNGVFTVDDGPPRNVDDPANFPFINSISKGECPRELDPGNSAAPVTVNLVRSDADYEPPARARQAAFVGQGRTLGSSRGAETSAAPGSSQQQQAAATWTGVDDSQPTTSLQLRLADGSRLVARFNHTHTLGHVRSFISTARSDITGPYTLATAFPPKTLDDDSVTLVDAGLLNAVLIQKQ